MAKQGCIRVWWTRNVPSDVLYFVVVSIQEAKKKLEELTMTDCNDPDIRSHAGGLEIYHENAGWVEYYDQQGRDIMAMIDEDGI